MNYLNFIKLKISILLSIDWTTCNRKIVQQVIVHTQSTVTDQKASPNKAPTPTDQY